ncbi:MAG: NlpC/P60 family protein [Trueperaceae bacterium]
MTPIDPRDILSTPFDRRHQLFELRCIEGRLEGIVDPPLIHAVDSWAQSEGIISVVRGVASHPGTSKRQVRLRSAPGAEAPAVTEVLLGQPLELLELQLPHPHFLEGGAMDGQAIADEALDGGAMAGGLHDGEAVEDEIHEWVRVRTIADRYLGWMPRGELIREPYEVTHQVSALRAHAYDSPRVQGKVLARLSWGSRVRVVAQEGPWWRGVLPDGRDAYLAAATLTAIDECGVVPMLESWQSLLATPYLWGGCSAWGLDCSGLVQLLGRMAGISLPRDSDEQGLAGVPVESPEPRDLALFPGHIGLCLGGGRVVHAGATAMRVRVDPISEVASAAGGISGYVRV